MQFCARHVCSFQYVATQRLQLRYALCKLFLAMIITIIMVELLLTDWQQLIERRSDPVVLFAVRLLVTSLNLICLSVKHRCVQLSQFYDDEVDF